VVGSKQLNRNWVAEQIFGGPL